MPQVVEADDYHEFDGLKDTWNKYRDKDMSPAVRFFEIGHDGRYKAVFYQGTKREAEQWLKRDNPRLWKIYTGVEE